VLRLGAMVVAMELAAIAVAYAYFGWPMLLIGGPVLVGTVVALLVIRAYEVPRRILHTHRAARWDPEATVPGGLMSGFFQAPRRT
jgi:hypothetical protein